MRFGARSAVVILLVVAAAAVGQGCGRDEGDSSTPSEASTTTTRPATPTSALSTVQDVLASRIRGEFPGVQDTKVAVDGDALQLTFKVGAGETPGDVRAYAQLAATELQTVAPELMADIATVTVTLNQADGSVAEEAYSLHGELLP